MCNCSCMFAGQKVHTISPRSCKDGLRGEIVYMSMESRKCSLFGGSIIPQTPGKAATMASCTLYLCPNQRYQVRSGSVLAIPGTCTNGTVTQVALTMYKHACLSSGGRQPAVSGNKTVGSWDWVHCMFDICGPTTKIAGTMYVIAGKRRCASDTKVGGGLLHMQLKGCNSLGGQPIRPVATGNINDLTWCHVDICRLGEGDYHCMELSKI